MNKLLLSTIMILVLGGTLYGGYMLGYVSSEFEREQGIVQGMRFEKFANKSEAKAYANSREYGDWVCVNVKGMSFERGLEVCKHEVGHEIFAEYCEKDDNINKCMEITK